MSAKAANEVSGPDCRERDDGVAVGVCGDRVRGGARVEVRLRHLEHVVLRGAVGEG